MKNFIFYTYEGFTFQPSSEKDLPDIENCQVIGWAKGLTPDEAFKNLKKENEHLLYTSFDNLICSELVDKINYYFSLKSY